MHCREGLDAGRIVMNVNALYKDYSGQAPILTGLNCLP